MPQVKSVLVIILLCTPFEMEFDVIIGWNFNFANCRKRNRIKSQYSKHKSIHILILIMLPVCARITRACSRFAQEDISGRVLIAHAGHNERTESKQIVQPVAEPTNMLSRNEPVCGAHGEAKPGRQNCQ